MDDLQKRAGRIGKFNFVSICSAVRVVVPSSSMLAVNCDSPGISPGSSALPAPADATPDVTALMAAEAQAGVSAPAAEALALAQPTAEA